MFADEKGESHFEDRDVPLEKVGYGRASRELPATSVIFRETDTGDTVDFHNPPRRQFIIFLRGVAELEASDGSTRRLGAGDVLLADDTTGRGHRLREIEARRLVFVPVPDDLNVDSFAVQS
ncbi:MAG TPA: hypothetical protein VKT20_02535 [Candidatus Dormibacteraeota bacterium]|nr:hypothetical protein [Candidatus Dormibacteraeota bacterium]